MGIKSINVPRYETTDGKSFDSYQDAASHQFELDNATTIKAYLDANDIKDRTRATVTRHLIGFAAFVAANTPAPETAAAA